MVINLRRHRRKRADERGRVWEVGTYRRDYVAQRRYRCFFNGKDVTHRTFYVDTRRGVIRMFLLNDEGKFYVDPITHDAAFREFRGHVKLRRKAVAA